MFAPTDVATPPLTPPVPPPPVAAALPPPPIAAAPPQPPQPPVGALRRGGRGALLLLAGVGGGVVISLVAAMVLFAPGRGFRPQRRPGLSREPAAPAVVVGPSAVEPGRADTSSRPAPPAPAPPPPPPLPAPLPAPTAASSAPAPRPFDVEAAQRSVQQAATFARSACAQKSGPPRVEATVVFEAGGQVDDVKMKPADHATPFGECVNGKLRTASNVPPFDGPPQPLGTTVARP